MTIWLILVLAVSGTERPVVIETDAPSTMSCMMQAPAVMDAIAQQYGGRVVRWECSERRPA